MSRHIRVAFRERRSRQHLSTQRQSQVGLYGMKKSLCSKPSQIHLKGKGRRSPEMDWRARKKNSHRNLQLHRRTVVIRGRPLLLVHSQVQTTLFGIQHRQGLVVQRRNIIRVVHPQRQVSCNGISQSGTLF